MIRMDQNAEGTRLVWICTACGAESGIAVSDRRAWVPQPLGWFWVQGSVYLCPTCKDRRYNVTGAGL